MCKFISKFLEPLLRRKFEKLQPDGLVKKIKDIEPVDFNVGKPGGLPISDEQYIKSYVPRQTDNKIRKAIENGKNILIYGPPLQGKSRTAYQVCYDMKNTLKGYWFFRPDKRQDIRNVPNKKKIIIFLDDLNKYAEVKFPKLEDFTRHFKKPPLIIATCRLGYEQRVAWDYLGNALENFEKITLTDITKNQAKELAKKTNTNTKEFNGTPGSVVIGLGERIREKINSLTDNQKAILRALALLAKCFIYSCNYRVLNTVSIEIFGAHQNTFESDLKNIKESGFVVKQREAFRIGHDKYFEFIDYHFEKDDVDKLERILINLKERLYLMVLCIWYEKDKDYEKMINISSQIIEYDPTDYLAYNCRGVAYVEKGETDKAIADYTKAIEINPNYAQAMAMMGLVYHNKGVKEKARYWYQKALQHKDQLEPWLITELQNRLNDLDK